MKVFLKVLVFSIIIIWWLYFFAPNLFKNYIDFSSKEIDINEYTLTPEPGKLYLLNLKILNSKKYDFNTIKWGTQLYFDAIEVFNTNIINLLDNENSDKKIILNTHIKQLEQIQKKLSSSINSLNNTYKKEQNKAQEYLELKNYWDSKFNDGFATRDANLVVEGMEQSYANWPIYTEHRILSNAGKVLISKLENIKSLVDAKLILLQNNSDTIVDNYDIIKWNILWKLTDLKQRLELNRYN